MNKIIYITRDIPETGKKILRENNIDFDIGISDKPISKRNLIKALKNKSYNGVISFLTDKIDNDVFDACPSVKIFANFSVGFNNVDIEEAKKRGVEITNTPGTSGTAVAEHTVALMFALTTRLVEGDKYVRNGKYKGWDPNLLIGTDMKGKIVGLVGVGDIGAKVAHMLHNGLGANIIYTDVVENIELEKNTKAIRKDLNGLVREADIISLHVPLIPSTTHLINKNNLSKMKKTAFIINTSRGPVIDEKALVEALKNKTIAGAGIDVFEFEPKITKGLKKLTNVVLTPHIASSRATARNMMSEIAAKNIVAFLRTGKAINSVIK